jgi:serine/threonine protein kinase
MKAGLGSQADAGTGIPSAAGAQPAAEAGAGSAAAAPTMRHSPSGRFVPPEPAELARHFPQLEILELLGQGGMGAVYKARQRQLNRLVALKILPPEISGDPAFAERFTREAQSLAQFNHPHVVTVHDFGEAGGLYYFIMEFVDGLNLRQMIAGDKLDPREALAIVPQVCEALQYAHDEGVVHRDIKPENILIDKKGRVKIADFGLAKLLRGGDTPAGRAAFSLTGSQQVMGTPHYMAPEQMERPLSVDHRADIYSLGVVFYEMLTGELPLGRFARPSQKVDVDVRLDEIVLRSLEKEPERRYQQASEVKTDVDKISRTARISAPEPAAPARVPPEMDVEATARQVKGPATGLLIVGITQCAVTVLLLLAGAVFTGFSVHNVGATRGVQAMQGPIPAMPPAPHVP